MKMVKSLLLGSAAGLVAVAGAQAADLPVKAKPVEYVKICSIYGAGFFYIPGTDTCIKIGGWVRAEYGFQTGNSSVQYNQGAGGRNNRINSNEYNMRARWVTSLDVRTQTEYGTLRAYSRAGFQTTTGETAQGRIYTERGFIQFAGFTFGKSQSYFDFFGGAFCYGCSYTGTASMTGAAGTLLAAYTATFGNGFTATISLEDQLHSPQRDLGCLQRRHQRARASATCLARIRRRTPTTSRRSTSAIMRRPAFRTSWVRCALIRPGARRRSQAPCTSCVLATTATTPPARARTCSA